MGSEVEMVRGRGRRLTGGENWAKIGGGSEVDELGEAFQTEGRESRSLRGRTFLTFKKE